MNVETVDVVQTVVRTADSRRYLIGLRTKDRYWEFLGGKVEDGETLKEAALRELGEETGLEPDENDILRYREGESYRSRDDEKFRLNPVLIEVEEEKMGEAQRDLSGEHEEVEWIGLEDFCSYRTLGQYPALENLGVTEGDVAIAVPERDGELLVLKRSEKTSSSGKWNFPGGKVEEGETRQEAALRELKEETGLEGKVVEEGNPFINDGELGFWRIFPFMVEARGEIELNSEHSDFRWVKPEKVRKLETLGTLRSMKNLELL